MIVYKSCVKCKMIREFVLFFSFSKFLNFFCSFVCRKMIYLLKNKYEDAYSRTDYKYYASKTKLIIFAYDDLYYYYNDENGVEQSLDIKKLKLYKINQEGEKEVFVNNLMRTYLRYPIELTVTKLNSLKVLKYIQL